MRPFGSIAAATAVNICSEVPLASTPGNEAPRDGPGATPAGLSPPAARPMKGSRLTLRLRIVSAALATTVFFLNVHAEGPAAVGTPQPLADALEAYAKASGYQLIYRSDLTAGLTSTGVSPNTPPAEALRQLLRGTDLQFSFVNSRTIVIWRSTPGTGHSNSAESPPQRPDSNDTDAGHKDTNPGAPDKRDQGHRGPSAGIAELFAACGSAAPPQGCPRDAITLTRLALEEVVVTGTRQSGLQIAASPAPIQRITAESLLQAGGSQDLMGTLAQAVPSMTTQAYGVDMAAQTLQAKLRGLSPNDVLVLVDGKRRHTTANLAVASGSPYQGGASVDLNFIPVDAIDHIEVLTQGAAAQYGTDAIAGVINIILKKSSSGGSVRSTYGSYFGGDGSTNAVSANVGLEPYNGAYINITAEVRNHGHSSVGAIDERVINPANLATYPGSNMTEVPGYPYLNMVEGDAATHLKLLSLNAGFGFDRGTELYVCSTYGRKEANSYENYRLPTKVQYTNPATGVTSYPLPFGFNPREATEERDYSVTTGLRGSLDEWKWDLSSTYGVDRILLYTRDSANAGLFALTGTPTPSNYYDGFLEATQWTTTLDVNRDFDIRLSSPLNVAYGVEYRRATYAIGPGNPASYLNGGAQSYPGFTPTDAGSNSRKNYAGYIDFALKPLRKLRIDAAGRYEHSNDFGSTAIGKLTGRYDFTPEFAIRGTVNNGFRAPTLAEEFYSSTNVTPHSAFVQLPPDSAGGRLLGLGNGLKAEKSVAYSLGLVLRPLPSLNMSLDFYQITITDRIVSSGSLLGSSQGVVVSQPVLDAITANGNALDNVTETGLQLFTNGIDTRTRGADLAFTLPVSYRWGDVTYGIAGTYNSTTVTRIRPTPAELGETTLFDATALSDVSTASPKFVVDLSALWRLGPLSVNLVEKIYGPSSEYENDDGDNPTRKLQYFKTTIPSTPITNLNVSYDFGRHLRLSLGALDAFDRKPPHLNGNLLAHYDSFAYGDNQGVQDYPSFSPFGINGGTYYASALFTF
jgi:iron complex outermembrane recepter protein